MQVALIPPNPMSRWSFRCALLWMGLAAAPCIGAARAETVSIGGTGGPLETLRLLGQAATASHPALHVKIMFGLGTEGAIKAMVNGPLDVAITTRELKGDERALGLGQVELGRTAIVFVTSHRSVRDIEIAHIANMLAGKTTRWADGTPVRIILRRSEESDLRILRRAAPALAPLLDDIYHRRELPIAANAQDNFDLAERTPGSFAIGTLAQLVTESRKLHALQLGGVAASIETLRTGAYPYSKRIYLAFKHPVSGPVETFLRVVGGERGRAILTSAGWLPAAPTP